MSKEIIPRNIEIFNNYIRKTNTRQLAINPDTTNPYFKDYTWTPAQSTAYTTDWHDEWVNTLFVDYLNPAINLAMQKKKMHHFIEDFDAWLHTELLIVKIVGCGKANEDDAAIWNVVLVRHGATHHTDPIAGVCNGKVAGLGRGVMDCAVRWAGDSSRPSIPHDAGADSVQYAYAVVANANSGISNLNDPQLVKQISKQAHFHLDADSANQGKWIVIYFRWYNTIHPELAGVWSTMTITVIA
jgi:hypothetical protein